MRLLLAYLCEQLSSLSGKIEVDESYFGAKQDRVKEVKAASGKAIVLSVLKRKDIVSDAFKKQLRQVIRGWVRIVYSLSMTGEAILV